MGRFVLILGLLIGCLSFRTTIFACEQCRDYGTQPIELLSKFGELYKKSATTKTGEQAAPNAPEEPSLPVGERTKWYFDTYFEWIQYKHQNIAKARAIIDLDRDTHAHVKESDVTQRFAYAVTSDLQVSLSQGFRSLYMREIEDEDLLGHKERSSGATDIDVGVQYRFLHQNNDCGSPVDMQVFADVKAPTGKTNNRKPNNDLFETEDQPGTGSWNETIGISVGKRWGLWGASAAYAYTHKGEGSQDFKEGDVNRLSISASRRISPDEWKCKIFLNQAVQGFIENRAVEDGVTSKDHGGQFIYAVPGVSVMPSSHLILTATGSVPIYQQEVGFHQKDKFGVQFNVGVRF